MRPMPRLDLAGMKTLALALLGLMLALFALSTLLQPKHPWLGWMRAFAEAASVGAIADWFAVTALFRHPMGLPLPHTAIIPRNKDEIGRTLGRFVEDNFLTPENLARRIAGLDAAGTALHWLAAPGNSQRCARSACELAPGLLENLDDATFRRILDEAVLPHLERLDVAALAGRVLSVMTCGGRHQALLDQGLRVLDTWLGEHRELIREKFSEASRYTPGVFDHYVVNRFVDGIIALLHEVAVNPEHEVRQRFDAATGAFIQALQASPEHALKGRALVHDIIEHLRTETYYRTVWEDLRRRILADIARPSSAIIAHLADTINATARIVLADEALRTRLDGWVRRGAETLLLRHRRDISTLIDEVVANWDGKEISTRIETEIGPDLQYIRINGTLVGGAAGVLLHGLGLALIP